MSVSELFEKVKGVNIFDLKSYMEPTGDFSMNAIWVVLNELLVNLPMFILNTVVGFFVLVMKLFENLDLLALYETYIYRAGYEIWKTFQDNSLVWLLFTLAFLVFIIWYLMGDNFSQRVLHLLAVLVIGLTYFGTIQSTSGGLYILRGIRNFSQDAVGLVSQMKISLPNEETISFSSNFSDTYVAETSYKAYLFLNTGRTDGKYIDSQTGKEETFDDSQVLGKMNDQGKFEAVKVKDRSDYLDEKGHDANEGKEENRWVSAVFDYIPIRMLYVCFKIIEAFIKALPILVVYFISFMAQLAVLGLMLLVPFALLLSFIPSFQALIFGVVKGMMVGSVVPSGLSVGLLFVFFIDKILSGAVISKVKEVVEKGSYEGYAAELFMLLISIFFSFLVYFGLWKSKGTIFRFLFGSQAGAMMDFHVHYPSGGSRKGKGGGSNSDADYHSTVEAVERGVRQGMADFFSEFDGFGTGETPYLFEETEPAAVNEQEEDNSAEDSSPETEPDMVVDLDIAEEGNDYDVTRSDVQGVNLEEVAVHSNHSYQGGDYFDSPVIEDNAGPVLDGDGPIIQQEAPNFWHREQGQGQDNLKQSLAEELEKLRGG